MRLSRLLPFLCLAIIIVGCTGQANPIVMYPQTPDFGTPVQTANPQPSAPAFAPQGPADVNGNLTPVPYPAYGETPVYGTYPATQAYPAAYPTTPAYPAAAYPVAPATGYATAYAPAYQPQYASAWPSYAQPQYVPPQYTDSVPGYR